MDERDIPESSERNTRIPLNKILKSVRFTIEKSSSGTFASTGGDGAGVSYVDNMSRSKDTKPVRQIVRQNYNARINHRLTVAVIILGLVILAVVLVTVWTIPFVFRKVHDNASLIDFDYDEFMRDCANGLPCDASPGVKKRTVGSDPDQATSDPEVKVTNVWNASFPKLLTESAIRLVDVNDDGISDVMIGFATGGDGYASPELVCDIYFDGIHPCFGGVMCLDGISGNVLWTTYTKHEVFALTCNADLDFDKVEDCIASGRAGVLVAISGRSGSLIWSFPVNDTDLSNFYTAQFLPDLNEDGVPEVLVSHGGDPLRSPAQNVTKIGTLMIVSGRTGKTILDLPVPDLGETYYSPQVYDQIEGNKIVLFGTGGETHGGSLWGISLNDLLQKKMWRARALITDPYKGVMAPAVLADINDDWVPDIIVALFNSSVIALDGVDFKEVWRFTTPSSETYTTPAVGYFDNDNVPDFFIKYMIGPGYPQYYYSESTVINGKTGKAMLKRPIMDLIGSQASPLSISKNNGSDHFLYWTANCTEVTDAGFEFSFSEGTKVYQKSRSNFCKQRFDSQGYSRMFVMGHPGDTLGTLVYDSALARDTETKFMKDTVKLGEKYLEKHPKWQTTFDPRRSKRHIGAHDGEGIQRLISTGTLVDSLDGHESGSIDVIFATYLFYPSKSLVLLPEDHLCIDKYQKAALNAVEPHSLAELEKICIAHRTGEPTEEGETYRDLFRLRMGAMTVYRKKLNHSKDNFLPFGRQRWGAYMGTSGDSVFRARP